MHSKSSNKKFIPYDNASQIVDDFVNTRLSRYQGNLETTMRGSDFIFQSVQLLHYKCYRRNFRRDRLYIDSPDWIKKTINFFIMR